MNVRTTVPVIPALAALGTALLAGCAGYQIVETSAAPLTLLEPPPGGMAKICVVRPQPRVLSYPAIVRDNGSLVGATKGQTYFCYLAEPGTHQVSTESVRQTEDVTAYAKAGERYYLKQRVDYGSERVRISNEWIDPQAAAEAIRESSYATLGGVPQREAVPQVGAVLPAAEHLNLRDSRAAAPRSGQQG